METLLNPDTGLIIWTIITFLVLVFFLKKAAWKPLLSAIEARETRIKQDLEAAQKTREAAEGVKKEFDNQMSSLQAKGRDIVASAIKEAEVFQQKLSKAAQEEARKIKEKTLAELDEERKRLSKSLRQEIAALSLTAAEKVLKHSVDAKAHAEVVEDFLKDLSKKS